MTPPLPGAAVSMKPRIFVTGPPGVGKSTLIIRVLEALKQEHPAVAMHGFYTKEMRGSAGDRVGFEVVTMDGRKARLATVASATSSPTAPRVGKYCVDLPQFEGLVLPELALSTGLFVLDEVGKMELFSSTFFPAVCHILDSSNVCAVIGSIPISRGRLIPEVEMIKGRPDVQVYTLSQTNREAMAKVVSTHLHSLLEAHSSGL